MEYIESLRLFRTIVEVKNFRRAGEMRICRYQSFRGRSHRWRSAWARDSSIVRLDSFR